MFEREHHLRVATALEALDGALLAAHECYFGGGTAIVLRHGEYRESADIDFVVANPAGYRELRQRLTGGKGLAPIVRPGAALELARDVRADQYGIRTALRVGATDLKFEIVFESRISLGRPRKADWICAVPSLTRVDMAATKLLANSDRWSDDSVYSRDLIDLAMLAAPAKTLRRARDKAEAAYGEAVRRDLTRAIERLEERDGRLEECMQALKMDGVPKAQLWANIRRLRPKR